MFDLTKICFLNLVFAYGLLRKEALESGDEKHCFAPHYNKCEKSWGENRFLTISIDLQARSSGRLYGSLVPLPY